MYKIDIYHCIIVTEIPMFYADGQTRVIEGMRYEYVAKLNAWKCVNSGRILTEQQIQEQQFLLQKRSD